MVALPREPTPFDSKYKNGYPRLAGKAARFDIVVRVGNKRTHGNVVIAVVTESWRDQ